MVSLTEMIEHAERYLDRKLTPDESVLVAHGHQRGMTLAQVAEMVNANEEQETPEAPPPRTYRYEAVGRGQVQQLDVTVDELSSG